LTDLHHVPRTSRRRPSSPQPHRQARNLGRRSLDNHRQWLIQQYGSICAYCGLEIPVNRTTLDHVYPRKGQQAYDRPDNLVLACRACNAAKADVPFISFIAQKRSRGVFLLHYGDHLSDWVKEVVRHASEREFLPSNRPRFVPHSNGEQETGTN
jgi:hypothetical protein